MDALCVLRWVAGLPATGSCPAPLPGADVDNDGVVTAVVALCVVRHTAGLPPTAACPFDPAGTVRRAPAVTASALPIRRAVTASR